MNTNNIFGLHKPIGHKNFWPNGGTVQPGCVMFYNAYNTIKDDDFIDSQIISRLCNI
jgi:hypothetical protein